MKKHLACRITLFDIKRYHYLLQYYFVLSSKEFHIHTAIKTNHLQTTDQF